ncbi:hypothetical protein FISHEDRAFT_10076, partial [Fistulina hepatica ATCC 64428]
QNPMGSSIFIAKYAPYPHRLLTTIQSKHFCPTFSVALKMYLNSLMSHPSRHHATIQQYPIPFNQLEVFTSFKLQFPKIGDEDNIAQEIIKARPQKDKTPAQFDTVLIYKDADQAASTGLEGMLFI